MVGFALLISGCQDHLVQLVGGIYVAVRGGGNRENRIIDLK